MLRVEHDAVLVVIHIGRILQKPGSAMDRDGDHPVVLPGRMIDPAGIALIFPA